MAMRGTFDNERAPVMVACLRSPGVRRQQQQQQHPGGSPVNASYIHRTISGTDSSPVRAVDRS